MLDDYVDAVLYAVDSMSKATWIVFYAGLVYGEYAKPNIPYTEFPDGCYMRNHYTKAWYIKLAGSMTPLNHCDIPKNLLALCLILGLN